MTAKPITEGSRPLRCWDVRRMTWKGTNDTELGGEAYHSTVSSASLQGKAMLPAVSHSEAYHKGLSSASLQKTTQNQMMHDSEAHNGGFWYASLLGCSPNDMEGDE